MNNVSPNYYAGGEIVGDYELTGFGFSKIPQNAVGIFTDRFNDPTGYIDTVSDSFIYDIISKSNTQMILRQRRTDTHTLDNRLGCIVSADRSTIYWVNNTNPLP